MAVEKVTASIGGEVKEVPAGQDGAYSGDMEAPKTSGDYGVSVSAYDDAGNVCTVSAGVLVSVIKWHEPKTAWTAMDRFNISDYNRIKNNLEYLHELAVEVCSMFEITDMGSDKETYSSYFYADEFNRFEGNLDKINRNILTKDYGDSRKFSDNGKFIGWEELNRIESAALDMKELLETQKSIKTRLSFHLGGLKGVQT